MRQPTNRQIQIMRLALGLSGLPCNDASAETVLLVVSGMKKMGSKFSLREAAEIEHHIHKKYRSVKVTTVKKQ